MNLERHYLTPYVSRQSIRLHDCARFSYEIWRRLPRQFEFAALTHGETLIGIDPIHAIRDSRETFQVFANFTNYQSALAEIADSIKKIRISVLHYPHLENADIEDLSLAHILHQVETACPDRSTGIEHLRNLLNERVDSAVLERVCGIRRLSRKEMAYRAHVSTGILKAQSKVLQASTTERGSIRRSVIERLST